MRRHLLLTALYLLACASLARAQEFTALGYFDNVRESSATGEAHCYGWSLQLWRYGGRIVGLLDRDDGLCGDSPCGAIADVSYNPRTGRLTFTAFAMPFVGTLGKNGVVGTLGAERVRLRRSNRVPMDSLRYKNLQGWCDFWRRVPRCRGISETCRVLGVPGP